MVECNLAFTFQIITIITAIFNLICGLWVWISSFISFSPPAFFSGLFEVVFSLLIFFSEVYIFGFYKYFGFLLKIWGKALMYFFLGINFFTLGSFSLFYFAWIFDFVMTIFYIIMAFVSFGSAQPLFQQNGGIELGTSSNELFAKVDKSTGGQA